MRMPRPPPPAAALTRSGIADLVGRALRQGRHARLAGDPLRLELVAAEPKRVRRRADPGEPGRDHFLGEGGVLREEAVAGVDGVGSGLERRADVLGGVEVRSDLDDLVRRACMKRAAIVGRDDRDRLDSEPGAGAEDANRDLTAVRDQESADGHRAHSTQPARGFRASARWVDERMRVLATMIAVLVVVATASRLGRQWQQVAPARRCSTASRTTPTSSTAPERPPSASRPCSSSGSGSFASPSGGMRSRGRREHTTGRVPDSVLDPLQDAGTRRGRDALRHAGLGERRQSPERRAAPRLGLRPVRRRRGRAIPLRPPLDDLERAEPAAVALDRLADAVRDPLAQSRLRRDSRRVAGIARRGRRHGSPWGLGGTSPVAFIRGMGRSGAASMRTPTIRMHSRRRRRRGAAGARTTARRSRWRRSAAS